jgi:hypothetical protein
VPQPFVALVVLQVSSHVPRLSHQASPDFNSPIYAFHIAGMTSVCYHVWILLLRWILPTFCPCQPSTTILLISASQVVGIIGISHHDQLNVVSLHLNCITKFLGTFENCMELSSGCNYFFLLNISSFVYWWPVYVGFPYLWRNAKSTFSMLFSPQNFYFLINAFKQ